MEEKINQRIAWIEQRVELSELAKEYIAFQMMQFAKYYHEQQVKSVDLADVVDSEERTELPASTIPEFGTDEWMDCYKKLFGGMRKSR